jgi:uncharacterized YccA/Bax inhibitor family protein
MALMRTSNPALNPKTFADVRHDPNASPMTIEGTVNKTALLLFLVVVPAAWVWTQGRAAADTAVAGPWILLGALGGFAVAHDLQEGVVSCYGSDLRGARGVGPRRRLRNARG